MHSGLSILKRHHFGSKEFENRSQDSLLCSCFHRKVKNILKKIFKKFQKKVFQKIFFVVLEDTLKSSQHKEQKKIFLGQINL